MEASHQWPHCKEAVPLVVGADESRTQHRARAAALPKQNNLSLPLRPERQRRQPSLFAPFPLRVLCSGAEWLQMTRIRGYAMR